MLELRLRSGEIVTFDGRIVEVFASTGTGERLHVTRVDANCANGADGASTVTLLGAAGRLNFTREEAPARDRLLAAIADAQRAYAQLDAHVSR